MCHSSSLAGVARYDYTSLWDVYHGNFDLPAVPDVSNRDFCAPWALMESSRDTAAVTDGNVIVNWNADTYVEQYRNGRFIVRRGFPDRPEQILFDNRVDRSDADCYTKLQQDGNLLTRRGNPDDSEGSSLWKTGSDGPIGQYFLGVECDLRTLSIYEYIPEDPGELIWTTAGTNWVSPLPPTMPAPVTLSPTLPTPSPTPSPVSNVTVTPGSTIPPSPSPFSNGTVMPVPNGTTPPPSSTPFVSIPPTTPGQVTLSTTAAPVSETLLQVVAVSGTYCTSDDPCPRCYGDCDTDDDCQGGLVCWQRNSGDPVPSCSGGEESQSGEFSTHPPTLPCLLVRNFVLKPPALT